jgi:hypothetical protein
MLRADDWDTVSIKDDWKLNDVWRGITLNINGNGLQRRAA